MTMVKCIFLFYPSVATSNAGANRCVKGTTSDTKRKQNIGKYFAEQERQHLEHDETRMV
jgi:hypothetical protein